MLLDQKKAREHILQRQHINKQLDNESEFSIDMVVPLIESQ
jgi:hypothetical protein